MADDYSGGGIPGPAGGYDSWGPPGPGYPGGLWIVIDPPPGFQFPTPPVEQPPPPNPQVGVEELPPTNTSDPAPLPNPGGEYSGAPPLPSEPPPALQREMERAPDQLEWEVESDGTVLVGPEDEGEFVWGWFPDTREWELLDPGEWPMQFVPRPPPPRPARRDAPFEFPTLPRWPFPRRTRPTGPRRYPEIGPPGTPPLPDPNMIPLPLPDEMNPNPPPPWPRVIEFPDVPEIEAIPQPSIPAPQIEPWPAQPGAVPDTPPIPRPPPPARPAPAPPQTAPQPSPVQIPSMTPWERWFVLPLTRRRSSTPRPSPLQEWIRARDTPPSPVGDPVHPTTPPVVAQPVLPQPALPLPDLDLTPLNAMPLQFAQTGTRQDECKCDEDDERPEPRPSNVVAQVKGYRRRMSLNSLENLR